jgi:hypothetical protein
MSIKYTDLELQKPFFKEKLSNYIENIFIPKFYKNVDNKEFFFKEKDASYVETVYIQNKDIWIDAYYVNNNGFINYSFSFNHYLIENGKITITQLETKYADSIEQAFEDLTKEMIEHRIRAAFKKEE